ncbi:hypothetical protein CEXT_475501 [Caerostris extrusa]|uniref:Uncharacterized protein n=1 Tax=Caerostris extrusa TaxID=172846 RepID=A0AAV4XDD0_CAEEX|nr:hypothetical protein CEXT_475501 [Caerostris extrusa]
MSSRLSRSQLFAPSHTHTNSPIQTIDSLLASPRDEEQLQFWVQSFPKSRVRFLRWGVKDGGGHLFRIKVLRPLGKWIRNLSFLFQ